MDGANKMMIYEANTTHWRPGDLVIHDADAKDAKMLMVVTGYDRRTGQCKTRYVTPDAFGPRFPGKRVYHNWIDVLHDPARFGIELPPGFAQAKQTRQTNATQASPVEEIDPR